MSFKSNRIRATLAFVTICALLQFGATRKALAQEEINGHRLVFGVKPLKGADLNEIQAQSDALAGLKVWTFHATSTRTGSVGQKYTGVMVGNSPYTNNTTTTTTVYVVPLILDIGGETFDPTVADNACLWGKSAVDRFEGLADDRSNSRLQSEWRGRGQSAI